MNHNILEKTCGHSPDAWTSPMLKNTMNQIKKVLTPQIPPPHIGQSLPKDSEQGTRPEQADREPDRDCHPYNA
jgi:hypothetical protein